MSEPAPPELPEFDARATRRAIRRGVLRTAAVAALLLAAAWVGVGALSYAWQTRGEARERARVVLGTAVQVSLPGYRVGPAACCNVGLGGMELRQTVEPRSASALRAHSQLRLRVPLVGRVERRSPSLPPSPVGLALTGRVPPEHTRALLDGLPDLVAITAVIELVRPFEQGEWERFLRLQAAGRPDADVPPVFLEPIYGPARADEVRPYPIAWPEPPFVRFEGDTLPGVGRGSLPDFARWVDLLDDGDEADLRALDLPPLDELRRLASPPRAYGLLVERATKEELRSYLDDPSVRSVAIADVAFDVHPALP